MISSTRDLFDRRNFVPFFITAELLLAVSIPFVLIDAYHTFLSSDAGTFVEELTPTDEGWRSFVDYTDVTPVIERDLQGEVRQVSLLVDGSSINSTKSEPNPASPTLEPSYLLEVPFLAEIDGQPIALLTDSEIQSILEQTFSQQLQPAAVLDLGETTTYASTTAGSTELINLALPVNEVEDGTLQLDQAASIAELEKVVAFPIGVPTSERLRIKVINRVDGGDSVEAATLLAASGFEIAEVGNTTEFDNEMTTLAVPAAVLESEKLSDEAMRLANSLGVDILIDELGTENDVATLLVGSDFEPLVAS